MIGVDEALKLLAEGSLMLDDPKGAVPLPAQLETRIADWQRRVHEMIQAHVESDISPIIGSTSLDEAWADAEAALRVYESAQGVEAGQWPLRLVLEAGRYFATAAIFHEAGDTPQAALLAVTTRLTDE